MSGGTTTTEETSRMAAPQERNVYRGLDDMLSAYEGGALGYHGQRSPGMNAAMQNAMGTAAGGIGNPYMHAMQRFGLGALGQGTDLSGAESSANQMMGGLGLGMGGMGQTAAGGFLNANPFMDRAIQGAVNPMIDAYTNQIAPGIDATFGGAGRGGSGLHLNAQLQGGQDLNRAIGDVSSRMYSQNYQSERDRMMGAQGALTGLAGQGIGALQGMQGLDLQGQGMGLNALSGLFGMQSQNLDNQFRAGQVGDQFAMRGRQDGIDAFNAQRDAISQLMALSGTMGQYGGSSTQTQRYQPGALDYAQMGLGAAGMVGGLFGM